MQETLASRLMRNSTAITAFSDSSSYCHESLLGLYNAREAVAYFLQKRFLRVDSITAPLDTLSNNMIMSDAQPNSDQLINPEYIAFGAGVNSLISQVLYSIANAGDVVLIPAPYYAAFDYDIETIARCEPHPVYMDNPMLGPTISDLENAAKIAEKVNNKFCLYSIVDHVIFQKSLLTLELYYSKESEFESCS